MAIYKLDVEQKYGQYRFRLYRNNETPGDFEGTAGDVRGLLSNLDKSLSGLELKAGGDSVIFRNVEYDNSTSLRETVRLSKY